tara:strand:+ start:292 stop:534 length:243 start_codon:yes stop_codon:yes gene_type:complete
MIDMTIKTIDVRDVGKGIMMLEIKLDEGEINILFDGFHIYDSGREIGFTLGTEPSGYLEGYEIIDLVGPVLGSKVGDYAD